MSALGGCVNGAGSCAGGGALGGAGATGSAFFFLAFQNTALDQSSSNDGIFPCGPEALVTHRLSTLSRKAL